MSKEITIPRLFDAHCHFRKGPTLKLVLPLTAEYCRWGLAMPNIWLDPILTGKDVVEYRDEIYRALDSYLLPRPNFDPLMTIQVTDETTPAIIAEAHKAGAVAGKVYPKGVTTNSDNGLTDFHAKGFRESLRAMQDCGMLLLLHGEHDRERLLVTKRESVFLPTLIDIAECFPNLKIVLEHVSSAEGIEAVKQLSSNVAATLTAHHMCLTLNDVIGSKIRPHNGCMPMPKDFPDRDAIIAAATSGNPKFFLGSDTAPHPRERKECADGDCGCFTSPTLPQVLAEEFEKVDALPLLDNFSSGFGCLHYGIKQSEETITMVKSEWETPREIGYFIPWRAGEMRAWQLA